MPPRHFDFIASHSGRGQPPLSCTPYALVSHNQHTVILINASPTPEAEIFVHHSGSENFPIQFSKSLEESSFLRPDAEIILIKHVKIYWLIYLFSFRSHSLSPNGTTVEPQYNDHLGGDQSCVVRCNEKFIIFLWPVHFMWPSKVYMVFWCSLQWVCIIWIWHQMHQVHWAIDTDTIIYSCRRAVSRGEGGRPPETFVGSV